MEKSPDKKIILSKAKNICSRKEKCKSEMMELLLKWGADEDVAREVVDELVKDKYIDEARYAEFFTTDSFRLKHWGRVKIRYHLKTKKLPPETIYDAFDKVIDDQEYEQILYNLLISKLKTVKGPNVYQVKAKLMRFAQSRGFETDSSLKILDQILKKEL